MEMNGFKNEPANNANHSKRNALTRSKSEPSLRKSKIQFFTVENPSEAWGTLIQQLAENKNMDPTDPEQVRNFLTPIIISPK